MLSSKVKVYAAERKDPQLDVRMHVVPSHETTSMAVACNRIWKAVVLMAMQCCGRLIVNP